jgi:hypothetical protein
MNYCVFIINECDGGGVDGERGNAGRARSGPGDNGRTIANLLERGGVNSRLFVLRYNESNFLHPRPGSPVPGGGQIHGR